MFFEAKYILLAYLANWVRYDAYILLHTIRSAIIAAAELLVLFIASWISIYPCSNNVVVATNKIVTVSSISAAAAALQ